MDEDEKQFFAEGNVDIPTRLLRNYHQIGLSNEDLIVVIQLFAFSREGIKLPSSELISARTNFSQNSIQRILEKLLKHKFISFSMNNDAYDLSGLIEKLVGGGRVDPNSLSADKSLSQLGTQKRLYQTFQREFGRMLTPMELQTISEWLKKDQFSPDLVVTALNQAVNAQILNLRYIEKILLNWKHNNVQTKEQAEADNLQHRQRYSGDSFEGKQEFKRKPPSSSGSENIKIPLKKIGEEKNL
ncbi:DnaD domain protein [Oenococcus oeni]|uniref:DnaD domain protein n=1 Tax=Oenococcus oeni TaxID=1247 RepID=UPI0008F95A63|nr:DnaD domain protein [Oenococcus oeni]OIK56818.1 DNA replication protein DnaD [Oenococcus oeni]OIM63365.1 DNA replication protein DnaD [Oenococcus oeni]SYW10522.1 Chromosome replication initiation protein dnaD [Oenococcus oeni]